MATERRKVRKLLNTLAGFASLVVVIAYVGNLGFKPANTPKSSDSAGEAPIADRTGSQLIVERYDAHGRLSHRLTTSDARHFIVVPNPSFPPEQDHFDNEYLFDTTPPSEYTLIKINKPVFTIFEQGMPVTELHANQALLNDSIQQAKLSGEVEIMDHANNTQLLTETLVFDTAQKQVFTEEKVSIIGSNSSTTAFGLQGNLAEQRWQLLSEVDSVITP